MAYFAALSSGGLRFSHKYEDGWFFGWTQVHVKGGEVTFQIQDLDSHVTTLKDWGLAGLKR